jgi:hypothetical protein
MPNPIKYNTSAETLALKKGNFWIGTGDVGKGPTSSTGFYNGISPSTGGFTIYLNKASGGPSIYTVSNEAQLTALTNSISVSTNLIKNNNGGNFADGTVAPFNGSYGTLPTIVDITNDKPYNGSTSTKAAKFVDGGGMLISTSPSPFTMTVGVTYTFSFWYRQTNSNNFYIGFNNQGGSGDINGNFQAYSSYGYFLNPTQTWQRCSWTFTNVVDKNGFFIYSMNSVAGSECLMTEFTLTEGSMPSGPGLTTSGNCLNWFSTQTDKMIFNRDYNPIITNGLVLNLDAGFTPSFATIPTNANSSTVTPLYDISNNGKNGVLTNGPTFDLSNGGSILFDGINDYISIPSSTLFGESRSFTLMMWVYGQPSSGFSGFLRINGTLVFFAPNSVTSGTAGGSYRLAYPYPSVSYQSITMPVNQWFLLTLTNLDSQTPSYQGYSINGDALTTTTYTGRIEPSEIRIGMADNYIVGKLGNVLAYNRVLTNNEIKQNYFAIIPITRDGLVFNLEAGNPISYLSGTTKWVDTISGNNGTLTNGPTFNSNNGGYINFDGVDDYFEINQRTPLTEFQYYDNFSIELWVGNPINSYLFTNRKNSSLQYSGWAIYGQGNNIQCWIGGYPNRYGWRRIYAPINVNGWNHIVYTNTSDYLSQKVYVNGIDVGYNISRDDGWEDSIIDYTQQPYHVPVIGTSPADNYTQNGGGKIPIARVYNKTLTASEVQQNFNAQRSLFGI